MKAMVGICKPLALNGFELCHPVSQDDFERIHVEVSGTPRQSKWKPVPMRLVRDDEGKKLVESDSPWLGSHALIFRRSVVDSLGALLREWGELLPLSCFDADIWIYNPTRVIDALDEAASSVQRFDDGRIILIQRHVFRAQMVRDIDIFKIPSLRVSPAFASQRFVDRWNESGLRGLEFRRVWSSPS